jgi:hypothetical protein
MLKFHCDQVSGIVLPMWIALLRKNVNIGKSRRCS